MTIELEAIYENGVLKLEGVVPLKEGERVRVTIQAPGSRAQRSYGIMGWTGDPKIIEQIALDPEFGIEESP